MGKTTKLACPIGPLAELGRENIVNLTKHFQPTPDQIALLSKGLTFIPTYKLDHNQKKQMNLDLQTYHRRLKLAAYFEGKEGDDPKPFTPKSDWIPKSCQIPRTIKNIIRADQYAFGHLHWEDRDLQNLPQAEILALKELQQNKFIVLKPADKGSAVVILDRDQYIWEAERQLHDQDHYSQLQSPIYLDTIPMVQKILDKLQEEGYINRKQKDYLKGSDNPRPRYFYLLPKIHKDPSTWPKPFEIPPGRPIVSDCNSETYFTAEFLEYFLNPISNLHPSFIKDTYDFLDKLKTLKVPTQSFLFTMDIESLYTNIDIDSGLQAIKEWFKRYPDPKRPDKWLLELLQINLSRNDFVFDSKFYLQVKGTAMGKRFAPSYANIFMAFWEESILSVCPFKPLYYFRFLDDIWGIWTYSEEEFYSFMDRLNHHHKSIKLTHTLDKQEVNFLDLVIFKGPHFEETNLLDTKVYFKKTDTHALLFKTSFHPKHTYKGILKSQLLRFHKICSQEQHFWEATKTLFAALRTRGYSRSFLRRGLRSFLKPAKKETAELIPLVSTFSKISVQLNRVTKSNFYRFTSNTQVLRNFKVISAFRRNKNLRDILVHSKLPPLDRPKKLPTCPEFQAKRWILNRQTKQIVKISQHIQPNSKNCIYLIYCARCANQYVGETKNSILTRLHQHRYNIKNRKETHTYLVKHFLSHGFHCLRIMGLQQNPSWTDNQRKHLEYKWILKLGTRFPGGLNEQGLSG